MVRLVGVGLSFIIALAALGWRSMEGQLPSPANPTAAVIETQIAQLQATLTAIAGPAASPAANATMQVGPLAITVIVTHVVAGLPLNGFSSPPAINGKYVIVSLRITNTGTQPVASRGCGASPLDGIMLRDDKERTFTLDEPSTDYVQEESGAITCAFQPGISYVVPYSFAVAANATGLVLVAGNAQVPLTLVPLPN